MAQSVPAGNHIRRAGEDLTVGQTVFGPGEVLTPGHLGVLTSLGMYQVEGAAKGPSRGHVHRR